MKIDKVDKAIKEEQILYDIAKDRYEKLGIKNCLRRMEEHKQYIELFEELKELREENEKLKALCGGTEEQGLLLRLPVKVGDMVYVIRYEEENDFVVVRTKIIEIRQNINGTFFETLKPHRVYNIDDFGKVIFLTRAEAEQKLKEMESGNNGTME